jgi:hypothetical protein
MQPPDQGDRDEEEDEVEQDIRDGHAAVEHVGVDAVLPALKLPEADDGRA